MLWLYIIGGIFLFIFILLLFSAELDVTADNNEFYVDVKYIFLKFRVYPQKDKPKAEKKKIKKKKKASNEVKSEITDESANKKTDVSKKTAKKQKKKKEKIKKANRLEQLKDILDLLEGTAKYFAKLIKSIRIALNLELTVGGEDAANTAISYGRYNALIWGLIGQASSIMTVDVKKADINCDFEFDRILFNIYAKIKLRLITVLVIGLCILLRMLVNTIKKEK